METEQGWEVMYAYNTEQLRETGIFCRKSYEEVRLTHYSRQTLEQLMAELGDVTRFARRSAVTALAGVVPGTN